MPHFTEDSLQRIIREASAYKPLGLAHVWLMLLGKLRGNGDGVEWIGQRPIPLTEMGLRGDMQAPPLTSLSHQSCFGKADGALFRKKLGMSRCFTSPDLYGAGLNRRTGSSQCLAR
jgi:hypothetical protein